MPEKGLFGRLREGLSHFKVAAGEALSRQSSLEVDTTESLEAYRRELYLREFWAGKALSIPGEIPVLNEGAVGQILKMTPDELRQKRELETSRKLSLSTRQTGNITIVPSNKL